MMTNDEFADFYRRYFEYSKKVAFQVVKNEASAEDICQDVFCNLYKMRERLETEDERRLHALVVKATTNKARDYLRKLYVKHEVAPLDGMEVEKKAGWKENGETYMLGLEESRYLKQVFQKLWVRNRLNYEIFVMVKVMDIPPEVVAEEMNLTRNNVNNRILRTKLWIKAEMKRIYQQ